MIYTGLFEKLFGTRKERKQAQTLFKMLNGYTPAFRSWSGKLYESELIRAAIHAKAAHASKMNVKIFGSAKPKLQTQLRFQPNPFQTYSQFLYRLVTCLELNTWAVVLPLVNKYDETVGIYAPVPQSIDFVEMGGKLYLRCRFDEGRTEAFEYDRCCILTKFQYKNDFLGDGNSALDQTMKMIDINAQAVMEASVNSASYRFMAQYSNMAFGDDIDAENEKFNARAAKKGGAMLLFPNTYENIKQIESHPFVINAAQMTAIQQNVQNYLGVSTEVMQNKATPEQLDAFFSGALEPLAIMLSEGLTKMLFSLNEQAHGARVEITADRLQYMSVQSKVQLIQTLGDRGMLTINEARRLLNYSGIDGGDAMMPIRGEYYNAKEAGADDGSTDEN